MKADLHDGNDKLIHANSVYVRSLNSNNTPSTSKAIWKDWPKIVELCFDNREADIGRFLRRHLSGIRSELLTGAPPEPSVEECLEQLLHDGLERFYIVTNERSVALPPHGAWESAFIISGEVHSYSANREFLNLLNSSNPEYTGWPVWLDSRGLSDTDKRPYVFNGVWEAYIASLDTDLGHHLDFMRLDPEGRFYLRRGLQDDICGHPRCPEPLMCLDFALAIVRVAEAIAVGIAFSNAMECDTENTNLAFAFRWSGLQGRELSSWAQPMRYLSPGRRAYQNEVTSKVNVPLDTPLSALGEYVYTAIKPLFEIFDGFTIGISVVNELTDKLIGSSPNRVGSLPYGG
ncbi:MAG TPA: hypothetical protein VK971_02475 [Thiohalobacter sp.]|nr:hypothetical protein [Thiohalobacter sp.]